MTLPLADTFALVTGASGGIGSAIALRLARDGAAILAHYGENAQGARDVVARIERAGGRAEAVAADLADDAGAQALVAHLDRAFDGRFAGRLDILVNNAGLFGFDLLADVTDADFTAIFNVNVRSVFELSREAAQRMTKVKNGRIINIGSVFGKATPSAGLSAYCGSKFAVAGLSRAWSRDLGPAGITVNTVQPALIQNDPLPTSGPAFEAMQRYVSVGRFGKAEDVANAVAFLARPEASYINGATIDVDGGWSA